MSVAVPPVVVEAFAINGDKNTIPVDSQIPTTPGAASYNDGFPPLTMTPITSGGIPPAGKDMNGILFDISAHVAWLQAGGFYVFAQEVADAGGYPDTAVLRSAVNPYLWFMNTGGDGNTNDPDVNPAGWSPFAPAVAAANATLATTLPAGSTDHLSILPFDSFLDLSANAAGSQLVSATGVNGQLITITNVSANLLTLKAMAGGTLPEFNFRLPADLDLLQNMSQSFRYSETSACWIPL
jgi:hypothetical protein